MCVCVPVRPVREVVHPHVVVQDAQVVPLGAEAARVRRVWSGPDDPLAPEAPQARAQRGEAPRVRRLRQALLRAIQPRRAQQVARRQRRRARRAAQTSLPLPLLSREIRTTVGIRNFLKHFLKSLLKPKHCYLRTIKKHLTANSKTIQSLLV